MKRIGFQLKLSLIFVLLVCLVLVGTTYFIYRRATSQQKEELQTKILALAKISGMLIDGDKHNQIKPQKESEDTASYQEIKEILKKIRDTDPLIDSVYTMVRTEKTNIWVFVVDSGDRKRKIITNCGEEYDVSHFAQMQEGFLHPSVDTELTTDKWGVWLSGYAPVYDRNRKAVAIVALDVSAASIRQMQLLLARRFAGVLFLGIIFSLFMGWLVAKGITQPLNILIAGVREVGKGNLSQQVRVSSRDEIAELAETFNKMTANLKEAQRKLQQHYLETIKALALALEAKDRYTRGHSERVTKYAVAIAQKLKLAKEDIALLEDVCILHDIGKIGIPEGILSKASPLSDKEWEIIRMHPEIGKGILKPVEFIQKGLSIVDEHHERPDGKGYPHHLCGDKISDLPAIVSVADAYDAMTSNRPYRKALSQEQALAILAENKNTQFKSYVVDAFIEYLKGKNAGD